jgi:hypothetical protein
MAGAFDSADSGGSGGYERCVREKALITEGLFTFDTFN